MTAAKSHPYLSGNFAPVATEFPPTECSVIGDIPLELSGGEYVRNGANPLANEVSSRDAHWFDGDGMLSGVLFDTTDSPDGKQAIRPYFVNRFVATDVLIASSNRRVPLRLPLVVSIATLVSPLHTLFYVLMSIFRSILLVFSTWLPGPSPKVTRISVANTAVVYHDGRALATCESGPPMRISLPGLETVGWWDGTNDLGEEGFDRDGGLIGFLREWTTAHPKVDPISGELIAFHSTFLPPYITYSVIPPTHVAPSAAHVPELPRKSLICAPVPGPSSPKMAHDLGVSLHHTVILDLPLSLNPLNLATGRPIVHFDESPGSKSRFGVFPRWKPEEVRWFEAAPSVILHTANTWDEAAFDFPTATSVNLLACRMNSASLVFHTGNIPPPQSSSAPKIMISDVQVPEDECLLYYFQFSLDPPLPMQSNQNQISYEFPLSAIPFELPEVSPHYSMRDAQYIYGCTMRDGTFTTELGGAAKIDCLAKLDVRTLIRRGKKRAAATAGIGSGHCVSREPVDTRSVADICTTQASRRSLATPSTLSGTVTGTAAAATRVLAPDSKVDVLDGHDRDAAGNLDRVESQDADFDADDEDPIKIFSMPPGWCLAEATFVPRYPADDNRAFLPGNEDDGWLMMYAFNEAQLDVITGEALPNARSELWIIDAKSMHDVVARVILPQRVPYGFHGTFYTEEQIRTQRPISSIRNVDLGKREIDETYSEPILVNGVQTNTLAHTILEWVGLCLERMLA